jgi:hypothetical protein
MWREFRSPRCHSSPTGSIAESDADDWDKGTQVAVMAKFHWGNLFSRLVRSPYSGNFPSSRGEQTT